MSGDEHYISEKTFLQHYIQNASQFMWFLGAGASRSAGLPSAIDIIWDLKRRYYCLHENQNLQSHDTNHNAVKEKIQDYMDSKDFPSLGDPSEYSFFFDLVFGNDYQKQQEYIHSIIGKNAFSPNIGHRVLAGLMEMGLTKIIFTTNFDEIVETSFADVAGKSLAAYHLEGSYAALNALNGEHFPIYAKLHGDFRYQSIKNLPQDLLNNDEEIQKCFLAAAVRYGLLISGYSGRDKNVMSMFREALDQNNAYPYGLLWFVTKGATVENNVLQLIEYARKRGVRAHIVKTDTFDETLSKVWRQVEKKPQKLDEKVRAARIMNVSIPLPSVGRNFPILRTNALPVLTLPSHCGMVEITSAITYDQLVRNAIKKSPDVVWTYTDKILFWGDSEEAVKILPADGERYIGRCDINDGEEFLSESTFIKGFFERAIAHALCDRKPLLLRRGWNKRYFAVVRHDATKDKLFSQLRYELKEGRTNQNSIAGNVPGLKDVTWAESVSIRLEIRAGNSWLMLRPDIWIKPLERRQEAREFLRQRLLRRYNPKSYEILNSWIKILLGSVGSASTSKIYCFQFSDYSGTFEIGTRTAYSHKNDC